MNTLNQQLESRLPHRIAWLLALIVFPLIWVGGLVTTTDAGMAVPDWPNTYNYNMFAYPVRDWFFGPWDLFVEHGHRLLGSLAGIVAIALLIVTVRKEPRKWVRWMAFGLLLLVIFQGALGGARVLMNERVLAKLHGCVGPAFFAAVVAFIVATSRGWASRFGAANRPTGSTPNTANQQSRHAKNLKNGAIVLLAIAYAQLILGAFLRHIGDMANPAIYKGLILAHLATAVLLVLGTIHHWVISRRREFHGLKLRRSVNILFLLILLQFGLGVGTWVLKYGWPVWFENTYLAASFTVPEKTFWQVNVITAHVAIGSLILAMWTVNVLHCWRSLSGGSHATEPTDQRSIRDEFKESSNTNSNESLEEIPSQLTGAN